MDLRNICIFLYLAACLAAWSPRAFSRLVAVRIVYTMDLRGQLLDLRDSETPGGALRCAGMIRKLEQELANSIVVSAGGDFFGSPESDILEGAPLQKVLNACSCDIYLPTGRDFSRGVGKLEELCFGINAVKVAANLKPLGDSRSMPFLEPFALLEVDGIRIAFVGLADACTPEYIHPSRLRGVEWRSSIESLAETIPRLRAERPDILVLLADRGLTDRSGNRCSLEKLASDFPSIDLIIARSARDDRSAAMIGNSLFVTSSSLGRNVGYVDIEYDTVADRIVARRSDLIDVDRSVQPSAELSESLREDLELAEKRLRRVVGESARNFPSDPQAGEIGAGRILLNAVQDAVDADVVLLPKSVHAVWQRQQTERDLWRIVPSNDRIATLRLTINQIEEILRENQEFADTRHQLELAGLRRSTDGGAEDGQLGISLRHLDGGVPHPRRRFSVAVSTYLLSSGGGRYERIRELSWEPRSALSISDILIRDALREYLNSHSPLDDDLFRDLLENGS